MSIRSKLRNAYTECALKGYAVVRITKEDLESADSELAREMVVAVEKMRKIGATKGIDWFGIIPKRR